MTNKTQKTVTKRVLTTFGEFRHNLDSYRKGVNAAIDLLESKEFTAVIQAGAALVQKTMTAVTCMKEAMKEDPMMSEEIEVQVCQHCGKDLTTYSISDYTEDNSALKFCSDKCRRKYEKENNEE